jgi:hypothetical protein
VGGDSRFVKIKDPIESLLSETVRARSTERFNENGHISHVLIAQGRGKQPWHGCLRVFDEGHRFTQISLL